MKKVPCYIRLHGSSREIQTSDFESIKAAKDWLICWNRPYTIVRLTPHILLTRYDFVHTGANVYKKRNYVAVVYKNNVSVNITKYSPKIKRLLFSNTFETIQELKKDLENNHK